MYTKTLTTTYLDQILPTASGPSGIQPVRSESVLGTRSGTAVPGFRSKLESGQDASSNYSLDILQVRKTILGSVESSEERRQYKADGSYSVTIPNVSVSWVGFPERLANSMTSLSSAVCKHDSVSSPEMDVAVRSRLLQRLREEYEAMQGQTFLYEARETLHMLVRPASALRDLTLSKLMPGVIAAQKAGYRRYGLASKRLSASQKRAEAYKEFNKVVAGTYLEYVFGLVPLINDCEDIVSTAFRALTEAHGNGMKTIKARSPRSLVSNPVYNGPGTLRPNPQFETVDLQSNWGKRSVTDVIERLGFLQEYSAPTQSMSRALELYGFSWDSVVPSAWEAIPFSWLADYFVNMGDMLSALFTNTANVKWANRTTVSQTDFWVQGTWRLRRPYTTASRYVNTSFRTSPSLRQFRHFTMERKVIPVSVLNLLPLHVTIPGADSSKWYNMAAVAERFLKPPPRIRF